MDRIAEHVGIRRDGDKGTAAEGERVIGCGGDGGIVVAEGDMGGSNRDGFAAVSVREADTHAVAAHAGMDDFAESLVFEQEMIGKHLRRGGKLG